MKKFILAAICASGFAIGFIVSSQIWPIPSRAERIARLFEEICLASAEARLGETAFRLAGAHGLSASGKGVWLDTVSASRLTVRPRRCAIETYPPFALSREDARELASLTESVTRRTFPDLPFDPASTMGPETISKAWITGPLRSRQRWGVYFFAYPDWKDSAGSTLNLTLPEPEN